MVKKAISFSIIILIIFLIYQYAVTLFKSEHSITYSVEKEETYFMVNEDYVNNSDGDYYLFRIITKDKKEFVFEHENDFNKQKVVVNDVETYEKDGWYCLSLIYKNDKGSSSPLCLKDGQLYSYKYAKTIVDLSEFVKKLPGFDYDKTFEENASSSNDENILTTYKGYFDSNEVILFYNYKRVGVYYKDHERVINFSNQDNYKNTLGALVDNYYIIPRYEEGSTEIESFIKYNVNNEIKSEHRLPTPISKQFSYLNGVYDGKLYFFDKSSLTQYEFNPYTDEFTVTGNMDEYPFAYLNGEETKVSVFEMNNNDVLFTKNMDAYKDIVKDTIYNSGDYAIYSKDGNYYKVYAKYNKLPILLFTEQDVKELSEKNGNIYYIKGDTLYKYNEYGLFTMIKSNELQYNYENVYEVYFK